MPVDLDLTYTADHTRTVRMNNMYGRDSMAKVSGTSVIYSEYEWPDRNAWQPFLNSKGYALAKRCVDSNSKKLVIQDYIGKDAEASNLRMIHGYSSSNATFG